MQAYERILVAQAIQMIKEQDLRGWTEHHDNVILEILNNQLYGENDE